MGEEDQVREVDEPLTAMQRLRTSLEDALFQSDLPDCCLQFEKLMTNKHGLEEENE